MQATEANLNWSGVNIAEPFFHITHSDNWEPLAVLQASENLEVNLLVDDVNPKLLSALKKTLLFYLYEKGEADALSYLAYHTGTIANMTSKIHFSFIEDYTVDRLVFFYETESQLCNLDDQDLKRRALAYYNQAVPLNLFSQDNLYEYDQTLRNLAHIVMEVVPESYGINLPDIPTFDDFRNVWLKDLSLDDFVCIINFLEKCNYIELGEDGNALQYLMEVFYTVKHVS